MKCASGRNSQYLRSGRTALEAFVGLVSVKKNNKIKKIKNKTK